MSTSKSLKPKSVKLTLRMVKRLPWSMLLLPMKPVLPGLSSRENKQRELRKEQLSLLEMESKRSSRDTFLSNLIFLVELLLRLLISNPEMKRTFPIKRLSLNPEKEKTEDQEGKDLIETMREEEEASGEKEEEVKEETMKEETMKEEPNDETIEGMIEGMIEEMTEEMTVEMIVEMIVETIEGMTGETIEETIEETTGEMIREMKGEMTEDRVEETMTEEVVTTEEIMTGITTGGTDLREPKEMKDHVEGSRKRDLKEEKESQCSRSMRSILDQKTLGSLPKSLLLIW